MHIITGLLLAGLAGRKKKGARSLVSAFRTGPVRTVHCLAGRVRFRVPSLADDANGAKGLVERLPKVQGVESVEVNRATGSVLIRYREEEVTAELLFAAVVRLLGLDEELKRRPLPAITREIRGVMDSLNRAVYERTGGLLDFWSGMLILMAAIGIKKLAAEGARATPAGLTLVWWASNSLLGRRQD
jgi:copper chaperone CopZ